MGTVFEEFRKGIIKSNPVLVLALGLCPTLAVSTSIDNALGMTSAVLFVLICANIIVSMIRNFTPARVRIAVFIVIIATLVTVVDLTMQAFLPDLSENLGIFIPLIVVNCIPLGRAEAFASKNGVVASMADGLGMGMGYTISLTVLATIREVLGNGTFYNIPVFGPSFKPFAFMVTAPGAFVCLGLMLCIMNMLGKK
jgi:electron transport complex protein RnfE